MSESGDCVALTLPLTVGVVGLTLRGVGFLGLKFKKRRQKKDDNFYFVILAKKNYILSYYILYIILYYGLFAN